MIIGLIDLSDSALKGTKWITDNPEMDKRIVPTVTTVLLLLSPLTWLIRWCYERGRQMMFTHYFKLEYKIAILNMPIEGKSYKYVVSIHTQNRKRTSRLSRDYKKVNPGDLMFSMDGTKGLTESYTLESEDLAGLTEHCNPFRFIVHSKRSIGNIKTIHLSLSRWQPMVGLFIDHVEVNEVLGLKTWIFPYKNFLHTEKLGKAEVVLRAHSKGLCRSLFFKNVLSGFFEYHMLLSFFQKRPHIGKLRNFTRFLLNQFWISGSLCIISLTFHYHMTSPGPAIKQGELQVVVIHMVVLISLATALCDVLIRSCRSAVTLKVYYKAEAYYKEDTVEAIAELEKKENEYLDKFTQRFGVGGARKELLPHWACQIICAVMIAITICSTWGASKFGFLIDTEDVIPKSSFYSGHVQIWLQAVLFGFIFHFVAFECARILLVAFILARIKRKLLLL